MEKRGKITKNHQFKISVFTINEVFQLPDESYSVSRLFLKFYHNKFKTILSI